MTLLSASSAAASSSSTTPTTTATGSSSKPKHHHHHLGLFPPHSASSSSHAASLASTPSTPSSTTSPIPSSTLSLPLKPPAHTHTHTHHQHHGVRAHLAEFLPLPRQALFDVNLTIHQLWNVPLVSGEFSVKWKFQHVHRERVAAATIRRPGTPNTLTPRSGRLTPDSAGGGGFLALTNVNNGLTSGLTGWSGSGKEKGKGREVLVTNTAADNHDSEQDYSVSVLNTDPADRMKVMPSGASMLSIPSTSEGSSSSHSLSPQRHSLDLSLPGESRNSVSSEGGFGFGFGFGKSNGNGNGGANVNNSSGSSASENSSHSQSHSQSQSQSHSNEARGRTPYVLLRDHHVKWGQTVNVTVQVAISRDTMELQPCELKLVVEQLSTPCNSTSSSNTRLGAVYLNLAEYVDKGAVTRRHLLRESKTNATLQLTLELAHVGGESRYKAPPLSKGEVMAGVSALLEKSAVGGAPRERVNVRLAYERTVSRGEGLGVRNHRRGTERRDVLGFGLALGGGIAGGIAGGGGIPGGPNGEGGWDVPVVPTILAGGGGAGGKGSVELGMGGGPLKTTENIIEAIFNPVPSSSPAPSPFTYYVPPNSKPTMGMGRPLTPSGSGSVRSASMRSSSMRSAMSGSGSTNISASGGSTGGGSGSADAADADGEEDSERVTYTEPESYDSQSQTPGIGQGVRQGQGRPPSIAPSTSARSERSLALSISNSISSKLSRSSRERENDSHNVNSHASTSMDTNAGTNVEQNTNTSTGKKWWKKFSSSRPASPAPAPPASLPSLPSPTPGVSTDIGERTSSAGSIVSTGPSAHSHTHIHAHSHKHNDSVKSSPGVLLHSHSHSHGSDHTPQPQPENTETELGDDVELRNEEGQSQGQGQLSTPQIVVRAPTAVTHPHSHSHGGRMSMTALRRSS